MNTFRGCLRPWALPLLSLAAVFVVGVLRDSVERIAGVHDGDALKGLEVQTS